MDMKELNELFKKFAEETGMNVEDVLSDQKLAETFMLNKTHEHLDDISNLLISAYQGAITKDAFTKAIIKPLLSLIIACEYYSKVDLFKALPAINQMYRNDFDKDIKPNLDKMFSTDTKEVQ